MLARHVKHTFHRSQEKKERRSHEGLRRELGRRKDSDQKRWKFTSTIKRTGTARPWNMAGWKRY